MLALFFFILPSSQGVWQAAACRCSSCGLIQAHLKRGMDSACWRQAVLAAKRGNTGKIISVLFPSSCLKETVKSSLNSHTLLLLQILIPLELKKTWTANLLCFPSGNNPVVDSRIHRTSAIQRLIQSLPWLASAPILILVPRVHTRFLSSFINGYIYAHMYVPIYRKTDNFIYVTHIQNYIKTYILKPMCLYRFFQKSLSY